MERLDRDATPANEAWDDLRRGDLVCVDPAPGDAGRVRLTRDHRVTTR